MELRLSEAELKLLTYLHEAVKGYGTDFKLGHDVAQPLDVPIQGCTPDELMKAASYLLGWKMIGYRDTGTVNRRLAELWLTERGEAYMREVEHRLAEQRVIPSGKRLSPAVLNQARGVVTAVATTVATEYVKLMGPGGTA